MDSENAVSMAAVEASVKARVPVMLVGAPGTGKTETVRALAKKLGYKLLTVIGSMMDPTDIVGLPKGEKVGVAEDGQDIFATVNLSPHWQATILKEKKVILFLDEFSNTSGATRASMLTMLQNREFPNGQVMPKETIVMGAMNPTDQAADGYELDSPTTNRILFIVWKTTHESWYEGMSTAWGKDVSPEELSWKRRIVSFIRDEPGYLHRDNSNPATTEAFGVNNNDPSEMEVLRYAWASRRSWDNLSRVLAFAPDDNSVQDEIARGLVGYSAASAFRDWLRKNNEFSVADILADPTIVDWANLEPNDMALYLRGITDDMKSNQYPLITEVFITVAKAGRAAEGAAYIKEILAVATRRDVSEEKRAEYKKLSMQMVGFYRNVSAKSMATV
jgi:hypothetical protein